MAQITVTNKSQAINDTYIGAMICHTPKLLPCYDAFGDNNGDYDSTRCVLLRSKEDLIKYFGDPYIDPTNYSDLLIAYDLVSHNIPIYVSAVYDMYDGSMVYDNTADNNIGGDLNTKFNHIKYNGFTDFSFLKEKNDSSENSVRYLLKSDIKFCQPIIEATLIGSILHLYVKLYYIDNSKAGTDSYFILDRDRLYKTIHFVFRYGEDNKGDIIDGSSSDEDIKKDFLDNGLELVILNNGDNKYSLIKAIRDYSINKEFTVVTNTGDVQNNEVLFKDYSYRLNSNFYLYDFGNTDSINNDGYIQVINEYSSAIDRLTRVNVPPNLLYFCTPKIASSATYNDKPLFTALNIVNPDLHIDLQNILLNTFNSECGTYLLLNTPDLSAQSVISMLQQQGVFSNIDSLSDNYNADLFFGFAYDYVENSLVSKNVNKAPYSTALLTFYNLMLSKQLYMSNSLLNLNISNQYVKLHMTESSAIKLMNNRCNSMVLFDVCRASVYGDRSLSLSTNLKYSHISRNLVYLRRLVSDYLETKKFILNTTYNVQSCINYIRYEILDTFISSGVLNSYTVEYSSELKTVTIKIGLIFNNIAEVINLDFIV